MQSPVKIDGSYGEGGGQILRTSLALSCVTGRPVEIINIRTGRPKPGLQPQHLTAVKAAAAVSRADVAEAEISSTSVRFSPSILSGGEHFFDVAEKKGSAGSTSLVLQTVLLPLCFAERPSSITVLGGTHVPWSPTFHYLQFVFLPLLARLGVKVDLEIVQWGWYPAGGGRIRATVAPQRALRPATIIERGRMLRLSGVSAVANLPLDIAERQKKQAVTLLRQRGIDAEIDLVSAPSPGKGTLLFLCAEFENATAGFDSLGAIGKRAEQVADEAVKGLVSYLDGSGALDPHLADQIVPYLALAGGRSELTTRRVTRHLLTNIWVVKQFLDRDVVVEGEENREGRVIVRP